MTKRLVTKIDTVYSFSGNSIQQHVPLPFQIMDICCIW